MLPTAGRAGHFPPHQGGGLSEEVFKKRHLYHSINPNDYWFSWELSLEAAPPYQQGLAVS